MTTQLKGYIKKKLKILNELSILATFETFASCENEVQVDNIAHSLIIKKEGYKYARE